MMDVMKWAAREMKKADQSMRRLARGRPPATPTPPPIPGVKASGLNIERELRKIPTPRQIIGDISKPPPIDKLPKKLSRILGGSSHRSIDEAILADAFDVIPVVGDVANYVRVGHAGFKSKKWLSPKTAAQSIDAIVGSIPIPIIGEAGDILTPTNTFFYLRERFPVPKKPHMEIAPPEPREMKKFLETNTGMKMPPTPEQFIRRAKRDLRRMPIVKAVGL